MCMQKYLLKTAKLSAQILKCAFLICWITCPMLGVISPMFGQVCTPPCRHAKAEAPAERIKALKLWARLPELLLPISAEQTENVSNTR